MMAIEAVVYALVVNGKVKERHQQVETAKRMANAINASGGTATVDRVVTINGKAERRQVWPRPQQARRRYTQGGPSWVKE